MSDPTDVHSRAKTLVRAEIDEFWTTQNPELLKALHLLTREGKLNQDARRKLKQIYHFTRLLLPVLESLWNRHESPTVVDVGSGKSYLGFLLYDLWAGPLGRGRIANVESRPELVAASRALAEATRFERMDFLPARIQEAKPERADLVLALHACDTATDDAILLALDRGAEAIALVPCCQAEVSRLLKELRREPVSPAAAGALWQLWRHPLHSREFGSHLTNVLRTLALEALGYKVTVTELTGWEHSMKNELILAEKVDHPNPAAAGWLSSLLAEFPVEPALIRGLRERGRFPVPSKT
jgi:hypothetical protein